MTEEAFIIRAVIQDVDPENIDISVKDYQLTIKGRKKEETVENDGYCRQMVRKLRSFQRTVPLPFKAVPEQIKATLNSNVLDIQIPRQDRAKQRRVRIKIARL
jgi:HSP20 family protein